MANILISIICGVLLCLCPIESAIAATVNATDCTKEAIDTAIAVASTGDTITIKGGAACAQTWTGAVTISNDKTLIIQGGGSTNTVVTYQNANVFNVGLSGSRITGIGFVKDIAGNGYAVYAQGVGWRIDSCKFTNNTAASDVTINADGFNQTVMPSGVIDSNTFLHGRIVMNGMGTFEKQGIEWAATTRLGTPDTVYIEDNSFTKSIDGASNVIDANRAGSYVARYNTIGGSTSVMAHSQQAGAERGTRSWEIYGNSFNASPSYPNAIELRGGTGLVFGNTYTGYTTDHIAMDNVRSNGTGCTDTTCAPYGYCDGDSYADGNQDVYGWPCRDQIGMGSDASLWSPNTEDPAPIQTATPAYFFLNRSGAFLGGINTINSGSNIIHSNRDYYAESADFNGTSGAGCGVVASRPATCTTGVGYWATDQSCSDLTGMVGANPTTPFSGTLYKCTAPNTWTAYYTPYTYPHPLRGESTGSRATMLNVTGGMPTVLVPGGLVMQGE